MTTVPGIAAERDHRVGQTVEWRGKVGSRWQEKSMEEINQGVLAITINADGLSSPVKETQAHWIKKQDP